MKVVILSLLPEGDHLFVIYYKVINNLFVITYKKCPPFCNILHLYYVY